VPFFVLLELFCFCNDVPSLRLFIFQGLAVPDHVTVPVDEDSSNTHFTVPCSGSVDRLPQSNRGLLYDPESHSHGSSSCTSGLVERCRSQSNVLNFSIWLFLDPFLTLPLPSGHAAEGYQYLVKLFWIHDDTAFYGWFGTAYATGTLLVLISSIIAFCSHPYVRREGYFQVRGVLESFQKDGTIK